LLDIAKDCSLNYTLILRSNEDRNLYYTVELEQSKESIVFYKGENYKQAQFVAKKIYNWLSENLNKPFDMIIEQDHGRGIIYTSSEIESNFPSQEEDLNNLYDSLCDEFSFLKLEYIHDINYLFRKIVIEHKLNEYQESLFLKRLKYLDLV